MPTQAIDSQKKFDQEIDEILLSNHPFTDKNELFINLIKNNGNEHIAYRDSVLKIVYENENQFAIFVQTKDNIYSFQNTWQSYISAIFKLNKLRVFFPVFKQRHEDQSKYEDTLIEDIKKLNHTLNNKNETKYFNFEAEEEDAKIDEALLANEIDMNGIQLTDIESHEIETEEETNDKNTYSYEKLKFAKLISLFNNTKKNQMNEQLKFIHSYFEDFFPKDIYKIYDNCKTEDDKRKIENNKIKKNFILFKQLLFKNKAPITFDEYFSITLENPESIEKEVVDEKGEIKKFNRENYYDSPAKNETNLCYEYMGDYGESANVHSRYNTVSHKFVYAARGAQCT